MNLRRLGVFGLLTLAVLTGGALAHAKDPSDGKRVVSLGAGESSVVMCCGKKASARSFHVIDATTASTRLSVAPSMRASATNVTTRTFVGTRSAKVELTPGRWIFTPSGGKQAYAIAVVSAV